MKRPERPGMKGEMCVLHKTVLSQPSGNEKGFVMRSCDSRCVKNGQRR